MSLPQKTLTLTLTGQTSTEKVLNRLRLDVTDERKWFVLNHLSGYVTTMDTTSGLEVITVMTRTPTLGDIGSNPRIVKETLRFVDQRRNLVRLLKLLALVQTSQMIERPLEFRKLVSTTPNHIFVPSWYGGKGRSDLRNDPEIQAISF